MQVETQIQFIEEIEQLESSLTVWERQYISSISRIAHSDKHDLSFKQIDILGKIHKRLTKND